MSEKDVIGNVRQALIKLHDGDHITDEELGDAIKELATVAMMFNNLNIGSMPEYKVFEKALWQDYDKLLGYQTARKAHA